MGQLKYDCPHCHTTNSAFRAFGEIQHIVDNAMYTTGFYCMGCYGGITAEIYRRGGETPTSYGGDIRNHNALEVKKVYPLPDAAEAPSHLPENIKNFFLQAANTLRAGNHDASAMMSRKTLEAAVKKFAPTASGKLYHRIEKLADEHLITEDLKEWAHIIRDDGNTAAHEEEPVSPEFAAELLSYTEVFLMYTLTMPGMIEERRQDEVESNNEVAQ